MHAGCGWQDVKVRMLIGGPHFFPCLDACACNIVRVVYTLISLSKGALMNLDTTKALVP